MNTLIASIRPLLAILLIGVPCGRLTAQHFHRLPATPRTVAYGYYSAAATPVLRIASGDTVEVETLITNRPDRLEAAGVAPADVQQSLRDIVTQVTDKGPGGHILTGPIYVEGADSGDVLEVRILQIDLAIPYGYNGCSGFLPANCDSTGRTRIIPLDRRRMVAQFAPGMEIPLHPFFGSMGVAPPRDSGRVSSNPPGIHAGNMDNKELVAGTTLFIPIHTAGALFEVGDGHAAQGDGEVDQTAVETSLVGRLQSCRPQGHAPRLASRRDADAFHRDGDGQGSHHGHTDRGAKRDRLHRRLPRDVEDGSL